MSGDRIKVAFIGGHGRSGSTLLDHILGQLDGYISTGELGHIWQNGMVNNELCGCGKPFRSCEFWNAVIEEVFDGLSNVDMNHVLGLWRSLERRVYIPQLIFPSLRSSQFQARLNEYAGILGRVYQAIQKISGCSVIVDSCGYPHHGFVLNEIENLDVRVIHLVRDSRAVAYSWQRKKRNLAVQWEESYLERLNIIRSSMLWAFDNISMGFLCKKASSHVLVRYEKFAQEPKATLIRILEVLKLKPEPPHLAFFVDDHTVNLGIAHTVAGNPIRFKNGQLEIRSDDEWRQKMQTHKRVVVTALTWPLLLLYGKSKGGDKNGN
ncbi:MAG: sulfotransferase [Deltaproteobacteria bacterium]|nr:sulfotransferase [Deltaproteobacteria bacterium]